VKGGGKAAVLVFKFDDPPTLPPFLQSPARRRRRRLHHPRLCLYQFAARAAALRGRSRSRSPYTELLLALSGVRNIGAALATFGLSDEARHLVVCRFDPADGDGAAAAAAVQGTLAPLTELDSVRDEGAMRKVSGVVVDGKREGGESGGLKPFATCRLTRSPHTPSIPGVPHRRRRSRAPGQRRVLPHGGARVLMRVCGGQSFFFFFFFFYDPCASPPPPSPFFFVLVFFLVCWVSVLGASAV
jgi:Kinase binding protein CGI-121